MFECFPLEINKRIRFLLFLSAPFVSDPLPQDKLLLLTFEISEEMEPNVKHLVSFIFFLFLCEEKFFVAGEDQGQLYLVDADDDK